MVSLTAAEQQAPFRIGLPQHFAVLVGDRHRPVRGKIEPLRDVGDRKRLSQMHQDAGHHIVLDDHVNLLK
jgi:hypothetical protein